MKRDVVTNIDDYPYRWSCEYDPSIMDKVCLTTERAELLIESLPGCGWLVCDEPIGLNNSVRNWIKSKIQDVVGFNINPTEYHKYATAESHYKFIDFCRNLRFKDLGIDPQLISDYFSKILKIELSPIIDILNRDHVQVRTVRPKSTDFNPPHRDSYIPAYNSVVNVWIPIICDELSTMPVVSGSQHWDEVLIDRTPSGEAWVNGSKYNVPAVFGYAGEQLCMIRPPVKPGQALLFTPYLVHGFGINDTNSTRFAIEFRLQIA